MWLTEGSLADTVSRSLHYQGGSPLFLIVEWVVRRVAGLEEVALRLPSVAGMAAAACFVYALGARLCDRWAGALAAGFFVCLPSIAFAASDARPYAMALAALTGSALALVRWMDSRRLRDGAVYAAAVGATALLHYLLLIALAAQLVFVVYRIRSGYRIGARTAVPVAGLLVLFLLPAIPTFFRVLGDRGLLSNPFPSSVADIVTFLAPSSLLYPVALVVAVAAFVAGTTPTPSAYSRGAVPFFVAWAALPVVVLYEVSARTGTNVFVPRYALMAVPGIALLAGAGLRRLRHEVVQVAVLGLACVLAIRYFPTTTHTDEDWSAAAAAERDLVDDASTPVLVLTGFIEASSLEWLTDPERADYLNAPAAMYAMEGRLFPAPFSLDETGTAYMDRVAREELLQAEEFVLVTRAGDPVKPWLDPLAAEAGYTTTFSGVFGSVLVYEFTRSGDSSSNT
ncbi:MAG: glycosyltransferase family 39 protein [Actinomycetota bacterium]|nr:glycosyltransferase family 39 protein [Actinomycetota bacterium]